MNTQSRDAQQSADSQASIDRLSKKIHGWFAENPSSANAVYGIALFGSRAVGRSDPTLSDWDLFLICHDDAPDGPLPSDDLLIFEGCTTEWHLNTVSGYFHGLNASSLGLSRAVERFGIPLYGAIPCSLEDQRVEKLDRLRLSQLNDALLGITAFGADLATHVKTCVLAQDEGFLSRTRQGEPYVPQLFKYSSNFAEHVSKLIVSFRGITPSSIHDLTELALHLDMGDPYRDRIAALNGATSVGNISLYAERSRPPEKVRDEPVSRSIERSADSVRLLRDFLVDHGSDISIEHDSAETTGNLKGFIRFWRNLVEGELSTTFSENPSEQWIGSMSQDASTISRLLSDLHERSQQV